MKLPLTLLALILMACHSKNTEPQHSSSKSTPIVKKDTIPTIEQEAITLKDCMGTFLPEKDSRFVTIADKYASRSGMMLQKKAYEAFVRMYDAAQKDGITLTIKSATRNFDYQKGIWERKWTGQTILSDGTNATTIKSLKNRALEILKYSSMPGTSRHHWGTDIDINSFSNRYFESGKGLKEYNWLIANAPTFGYCQPYTDKSSGRTGYNEEKWHWSYMPISKGFTHFAKAHLKDADITGFKGAEVAKDIKVVKNYVLGINKSCF